MNAPREDETNERKSASAKAPRRGPNLSWIRSASPRCVAIAIRTVTTYAMKSVSGANGMKTQIPYVAPVIVYESMLGPSFSPITIRVPRAGGQYHEL